MCNIPQALERLKGSLTEAVPPPPHRTTLPSTRPPLASTRPHPRSHHAPVPATDPAWQYRHRAPATPGWFGLHRLRLRPGAGALAARFARPAAAGRDRPPGCRRTGPPRDALAGPPRLLAGRLQLLH